MKIDNDKLEEIVAAEGVTKQDLARVADLNPQLFYRLKGDKVLGSKSTRKVLEAIPKLRALKAGAQAG